MAGEALGTATLILDADDRLLTTKLDQVQRKAQGTGNSISQALGAGVESVLPTQLTQLSGLFAGGAAAAAAFGVAVVAAGAFAVSAANEMNGLTKQLQFLTNDAEQTQQVFENLRAFDLESAFTLPGLIAETKKLINYGLAAKDAVDVTRAAGNVAAVAGTQIGLLTDNLAKSIGKGFFDQVDITQLANAGLSLDALSVKLKELYGKDLQQLRAEFGKIPADKVVAAFLALSQEGGRYFEGAKKGSTDLEKSLTSLETTLKQSLVPLGEAILPAIILGLDTATKGITAFSTALGKVVEIAQSDLGGLGPKLDELGKRLNSYNPFKGANDLLGDLAPPAPALPKIKTTPAEQQKKDSDATKKELDNIKAIAEVREKMNKTISEASNRVEESKLALQYEGNALIIAKARLEVDRARKADAKAIAEFNSVLSKSGFKLNTPEVAEAAAKMTVAGLNFKDATQKGALAVKEAAAATEAATKRANETINSSEDRLAEAQALLGLEGNALKIAEARFKVEQAITAEAQARADYEAELKKAKGDETEPNVIEAAGVLIAAGNDVETAITKGARAASDALKDATREFQKAEIGVFRLLTNKRQGEILNESIDKIQSALGKGAFDLSKVANDLGTALDPNGVLRFALADPEKILRLGEELSGFGEVADKLAQTQAQAANGLARSIDGLANKDWQIYINVQGQDAVVQGAMLGGVN